MLEAYKNDQRSMLLGFTGGQVGMDKLPITTRMLSAGTGFPTILKYDFTERLEGTVHVDIGMSADFWELLAGPESDTGWTRGSLAVWRGMPAGSPERNTCRAGAVR